MDWTKEINPPTSLLRNTCAETLRFGGAGVQQSVCCRVWIFWSIYCLALWCFHISWRLLVSKFLLCKHYFCMLLILFQTAQNIAFSQINISCLPPIPFFLFPNLQLIPSWKKHRVFTGKFCMCLSSHFPIPALIHNLFRLVPQMDEICKPPVQCECNLKCVSPPNITFGNTRAETLRFGGAVGST